MKALAKTRSVRFVVALAVLTLVLLELVISTIHKRMISDTNPRSVVIGDMHLMIPANCLSTKGDPSPVQPATSIQLELPDMKACLDWSVYPYNPNNVTVTIIQRRASKRKSKEKMERWIDIASAHASFEETRYGHGLTRYSPRGGSYEAEYFFNEEHNFIMRCYREEFSAAGRSTCGSDDVAVSAEVVIGYHYNRAHLANWKSIQENLIRLIQSLAAKE